MSTRTLARLILRSSKHCLYRNVTLPTIALRYYRDSVTVILTAPSLETYDMSRTVTEQIVTHSRRLVEFSVPKSLKLTQFDRFTSLIDYKKHLAMRKPTRRTKNETLGFKYLLF